MTHFAAILERNNTEVRRIRFWRNARITAGRVMIALGCTLFVGILLAALTGGS